MTRHCKNTQNGERLSIRTHGVVRCALFPRRAQQRERFVTLYDTHDARLSLKCVPYRCTHCIFMRRGNEPIIFYNFKPFSTESSISIDFFFWYASNVSALISLRLIPIVSRFGSRLAYESAKTSVKTKFLYHARSLIIFAKRGIRLPFHQGFVAVAAYPRASLQSPRRTRLIAT